jgi:hypothetical protein
MTPEQIKLARHALGLPNSRRISYRNYYVAGPGNIAYDQWHAMVFAGFATSYAFSGDDVFYLTELGAKAALLPNEYLNKDDFPQVSD